MGYIGVVYNVVVTNEGIRVCMHDRSIATTSGIALRLGCAQQFPKQMMPCVNGPYQAIPSTCSDHEAFTRLRIP